MPLVLLHAAFVLTGVVTTLLGPILPILVVRWALDDWQAGLLFTLQFVGSMLGVAASGAGMSRLGFRATLVIGLLFMAAGVMPLALGARALGFTAVFIYGVGLGLTIPTTNLTVAEWRPAHRASALNVLNLAWGVGAVSAPPIVALLHRTEATHLFLFALAAVLALMALTLSRVPWPAVGRAPAGEDEPPSDARVSWRRVLPFGALLFVYVGTETALAGWAGVHAQRLGAVPGGVAPAVPAFFWGALLFGRAAAPLVLRWISETRLLAMSLAIATGGAGLVLAAGSARVLLIAVTLSGLGLSTVFPNTVALFSRRFGAAAGRLAGLVFALAGLGGAVLPPLVGALSTAFESLRIGLVVPLFGCVAMLALLRAVGRGRPSSSWQRL